MDGPSDSKRPRIATWSASASQTSALPHPHANAQLPPPQSHHHQHAASPYPLHSHRPGELGSAPPPAPPGPHGHGLQHPEVDRRRHEQDLAPMQDHYRQQPSSQPPPHSPAQVTYAGYPARDAAIKREAVDNQRRQSSNHLPDSPAHHHHPPPQHVSASYSESQRHMPYDNSPGGYRPSYPPPTPPVSHPQSFEPPAVYGQPPAESFYSIYSSATPSKKKNTRASQACDQCRQLKAKCDETKPCKTCRDKGTECRYRDPVPKATDKAQSDILDGITMMQSTLNTLTEHFQRMDQRLTKIEGTIPAGPGPIIKSTPGSESNSVSQEASFPSAYQEAHRDQPMSGSVPPPSNKIQMMDDDEMETEPGPPVAPGEPAIPMNHTTLAGLLLDWPPIRALTQSHLERQGVKYAAEFPIAQEQNRGLLIPYGRGEDSTWTRRQAELVDHGTIDSSSGESPEVSSPSPKTDWGNLGSLNAVDHVEYRGGTFTSQGNPDFSEEKIWLYVQSFKDNILNMHPIIQPDVLDAFVQNFIDATPVSNAPVTQPQATPAFAVGVTETVGSKRKRSPDGDDTEPAPAPRSGRPNRNIQSAMVLAVLALGKICLFRDHVPDALYQVDPTVHGSPMMRNGVPGSPSQTSSPGFLSRSLSSGLPSPHNADPNAQNRRSSFHTSGAVKGGYNLKKNCDVIPGLEYYALASDILGNHAGSYNRLTIVYANIFAGLFQGQLGRPLESFAYIHQASHKLQVLLRPHLDRLRGFKRNNVLIPDTRNNQYALAFWTCLQLESDLIAELPLPPSGLLSYEDDMPHPNMSLLRGYPQRVLDSYPGQLYLRTHLNSIHRMFYSPEDPSKKSSGENKFKNVDLVSSAVSGMDWVAPSFAFKEDDPPAEDILAARLRAKYWGAQVITYRPFVRQILQFSHNCKHPSSSNVPAVTEFRDDVEIPRLNPEAKTSSDIDDSLLELAKKGIKALIESTRPLHGLGEQRPIITNVFGTAHAQWGNMLVLSAAYRDPILRDFIDEGLLRVLFEKTIAFLRQSAPLTSSLRIDMNILDGVYKDIFHGSETRPGSQLSGKNAAIAANQVQKQAMVPPNAFPAQTDSAARHGVNGNGV